MKRIDSTKLDYHSILKAIDNGEISEEKLEAYYKIFNDLGDIQEAGEIRGRYYTNRNNKIIKRLLESEEKHSEQLQALSNQNDEILEILQKIENNHLAHMEPDIRDLKLTLQKLNERISKFDSLSK